MLHQQMVQRLQAVNPRTHDKLMALLKSGSAATPKNSEVRLC